MCIFLYAFDMVLHIKFIFCGLKKLRNLRIEKIIDSYDYFM